MDMTIELQPVRDPRRRRHLDTACVGDHVLQFTAGKYQSGWKLDTPPDDGDLRPGHDYR